jgi:riboflavin synthase
MFTGIVYGTFKVLELSHEEGIIRLAVELPLELTSKIELGSSISVDGVCLTVSKILENKVYFDVILETIRVTTLANLVLEDLVNIELSLSTQKEIGGHIVSGHIDCSAEISSIEKPDKNNSTLTFSIDNKWNKYIFQKGFIAVNGCSLTVGTVNKQESTFSIYLIPETIRRTNLGQKKVGDKVNIEVEKYTQVLVDTVENFLEKSSLKLVNNNNQKELLIEELEPMLSLLVKKD